ncbi:hypothetical protein NC651_038882 [Populus alba x Populus x berolinensis]|nr:hypothetical protein NC651_038882 [Populus alba x Populus x berolinensis]
MSQAFSSCWISEHKVEVEELVHASCQQDYIQNGSKGAVKNRVLINGKVEPFHIWAHPKSHFTFGPTLYPSLTRRKSFFFRVYRRDESFKWDMKPRSSTLKKILGWKGKGFTSLSKRRWKVRIRTRERLLCLDGEAPTNDWNMTWLTGSSSFERDGFKL